MGAIFLRTASGLSNQARFFGVDVVVYFEGGEDQCTIADLQKAPATSEDIDTMFWQTVFKMFRPKLHAHFKSVGSKQSVLPICQLILSGAVTDVIAGMDRDWDHARRKKLRHPHIIYTRGYSWENDVFTQANLKLLCKRLSLDDAKNSAVSAKIDRAFSKFDASFRTLVLLEYALARAGAPPCDRGALKNAIQIRTPNAPVVSRSSIASLLWHARRTSQNLVFRSRIRGLSVSKDLYGHAVERFSLALVHHICATDLKTKISNDVCSRLLIGIFERSMKRQDAAAKHYRDALLAIRTKRRSRRGTR